MKRDQTIIKTSCSFCPWSFTGTFKEGREAARRHRITSHPEAVPVRRRRVGYTPRIINEADDGHRREAVARAAELAETYRKREEAG